MHSIQVFARSTGALYFLVAILGGFGIGYVPSLIVSGDIGATVQNIAANETMVRWSILSALLTQIGHVFLVLMLYTILRSVSEVWAKLMVVLALVGIPIAMLNEASHGAVLLLLNGADPDQNLVSLFLGVHKYGIQIVQIFWGLWLFPMGYLIFKSDFLPKIIGVTLMIGCFGYLAESLIFMINPDFPISLSIYLFWGEIFITFWLLIMGVNAKKWEEANQV